MKDNIIKAVDKDGKETDVDMDLCFEQAQDTLDYLYDKENVIHHYDFGTTIYALFTNCITILSNTGWDEKQLMELVIEYSGKYGTPLNSKH